MLSLFLSLGSLLVAPYCVSAYPYGAGACKVGVPSPMGYHVSTDGGKAVYNGTLNDGGYRVKINDVTVKNSMLLKGSILKINPGTTYSVLINSQPKDNARFKGVLIAMTPQSSNDTTTTTTTNTIVFEIAPSDNATLKMADACLSQSETNTMGITHRINSWKEEAGARISIWNETLVWLDLNVVQVNDVKNSKFYYNQLKLQSSPCQAKNSSCLASKDCCLGYACIRQTKNDATGATCTVCKKMGSKCFKSDECCDGGKCVKQQGKAPSVCKKASQVKE